MIWGVVDLQVGTFLIDTLIKVARLQITSKRWVWFFWDPPTSLHTQLSFSSRGSKTHPAFYHVYEFSEGKMLGVLRANPRLRSLVVQTQKKDGITSFPMDVVELPMLVPPTPWTSANEGGFLVTPSESVSLTLSPSLSWWLSLLVDRVLFLLSSPGAISH